MFFVQEIIHGNTKAYITALPLSQLQNRVTFSLPAHLKQFQPWLEGEEKSVDEIASFTQERVANDGTWFQGAISIALYTQQPEQEPSFDPVSQQAQHPAEFPKYGTLQLSGSEVWIIVDGLHRLRGMFKALRNITWKKEKLSQNPIPVIFLPISSVEQLQDLMVRMRKSAHMVTRGEAIRTAIADHYSAYANRLKGDDEPEYPGVFPRNLVNWKSNTITNRLPKLTTLSVLYDSSKILDESFGKFSDPTPEQLEQRYYQIYAIWKQLLERFRIFQQALSGPPEQLPSLREKFLCVRPTGQLILVHIMALAIKEKVLLADVLERLNEMSWEMGNPLWQKVIIVEGRVNGRAAATQLTAKLIAYLIGIPFSETEMDKLKSGYKEGKEALPSPLFEPLQLVDNQETASLFQDDRV